MTHHGHIKTKGTTKSQQWCHLVGCSGCLSDYSAPKAHGILIFGSKNAVYSLFCCTHCSGCWQRRQCSFVTSWYCLNGTLSAIKVSLVQSRAVMSQHWQGSLWRQNIKPHDTRSPKGGSFRESGIQLISLQTKGFCGCQECQLCTLTWNVNCKIQGERNKKKVKWEKKAALIR